MKINNLSLEEISRLGEKFYVEKLKDTLEKQYMGQYVVIDVEERRYKVSPDRLIAIANAQKEFGDKLFYIIQIGNTQNPSVNYSAKKYAWNL